MSLKTFRFRFLYDHLSHYPPRIIILLKTANACNKSINNRKREKKRWRKQWRIHLEHKLENCPINLIFIESDEVWFVMKSFRFDEDEYSYLYVNGVLFAIMIHDAMEKIISLENRNLELHTLSSSSFRVNRVQWYFMSGFIGNSIIRTVVRINKQLKTFIFRWNSLEERAKFVSINLLNGRKPFERMETFSSVENLPFLQIHYRGN